VVQPRFRPDDVLNAIERERVTSFFVVPTMLDALTRHPHWECSDLTSLRTVLVGGAPPTEETLRAWTERGLPVQQGYGTTETAPGVFLLPAQGSAGTVRSVGRAHWWVEGRVVRTDGADVVPGEVGEIIAQG